VSIQPSLTSIFSLLSYTSTTAFATPLFCSVGLFPPWVLAAFGLLPPLPFLLLNAMALTSLPMLVLTILLIWLHFS
jgi:hypothetical protein